MGNARSKREDVVPQVREYSTNPIIQKFYEEHGDHVAANNRILFHDGAMLHYSADGYGGMTPPPSDNYERAKLICRYWEVIAKRAEDAFNQFQAYLHGNGMCPAHIRTDTDKIDHLVALQAAAKEARSNLHKAKKNMEDSVPAWVVAKKRAEAREAKRRHEFLSRIDAIKL